MSCGGNSRLRIRVCEQYGGISVLSVGLPMLCGSSSHLGIGVSLINSLFVF